MCTTSFVTLPTLLVGLSIIPGLTAINRRGRRRYSIFLHDRYFRCKIYSVYWFVVLQTIVAKSIWKLLSVDNTNYNMYKHTSLDEIYRCRCWSLKEFKYISIICFGNMYPYLNRIIHWEIEKNQRNKGKAIRIYHCYVENINESDE